MIAELRRIFVGDGFPVPLWSDRNKIGRGDPAPTKGISNCDCRGRCLHRPENSVANRSAGGCGHRPLQAHRRQMQHPKSFGVPLLFCHPYQMNWYRHSPIKLGRKTQMNCVFHPKDLCILPQMNWGHMDGASETAAPYKKCRRVGNGACDIPVQLNWTGKHK